MEITKTDAKMQGTEAKKDNVRELVKNPATVLPQTIKTIEGLYKKIQHRDRLETYLEQLNGFEVKKKEEDLEPTNYYAGCKIEIADDSNNKFSLKHPLVIKETIEFLKGRFSARLTEIEAQIILPTNKAA